RVRFRSPGIGLARWSAWGQALGPPDARAHQLTAPGSLLLEAATVASAASAASGARAGFDPASTLGWSVPALVLVPLMGFVVLLTMVRARRASSNTTVFFLAATLIDLGLVAAARANKSDAYTANLTWFSVDQAFSGADQFHALTVALSLRVDHVALAAVAVIL